MLFLLRVAEELVIPCLHDRRRWSQARTLGRNRSRYILNIAGKFAPGVRRSMRGRREKPVLGVDIGVAVGRERELNLFDRITLLTKIVLKD